MDADVLAPGAPLTFVHPVVRSVVYDDLSAAHVQRLHRRAAAALAAERAPLDAIAPHLLRVEPANDAWVRQTLVAAAAQARGGGAPAVAAEYVRRALQEAPPEDERAPLLQALALADFDARGKPALPAFEEALEAADDPRAYALIALDFGRALHVLGDHPESARVHDRAFERLGETESDLARTLEAETIIAALQDFSTAPIAAERLPAAAGRLGAGGAPDAMVTAALALVSAAAGDPGAAALADRALGRRRAVPPGEPAGARGGVLRAGRRRPAGRARARVGGARRRVPPRRRAACGCASPAASPRRRRCCGATPPGPRRSRASRSPSRRASGR